MKLETNQESGKRKNHFPLPASVLRVGAEGNLFTVVVFVLVLNMGRLIGVFRTLAVALQTIFLLFHDDPSIDWNTG